MAKKKHPNDEYENPGSPTARQPIPPEIFPEEVAKASSPAQAGDRGEGGGIAPAPAQEDARDEHAAGSDNITVVDDPDEPKSSRARKR